MSAYPGIITEVLGNTVKLREWYGGIWCGCETLVFSILEDGKLVGTETLVNWNDKDQTLTFEPGTSLRNGRAIEFVPPPKEDA